MRVLAVSLLLLSVSCKKEKIEPAVPSKSSPPARATADEKVVEQKNALVSQPRKKDWARYETDEFSIDYPKDMLFKNDGMMGAKFFLYFKEGDSVRNNINLMVQPLPGKLSAKQMLIAAEAEIKGLDDAKILEKEIKGGVPFVVWEGTIGKRLRFKQLFQQKNLKNYVLTYTALPENFSSDLEDFESIAATFVVK